MAKQCPNCRTVVPLTAETCGHCGLRFFAKAKESRDLVSICLQIGAGVFLLAALAATVLRYF
jgi:hypothetical protein